MKTIRLHGGRWYLQPATAFLVVQSDEAPLLQLGDAGRTLWIMTHWYKAEWRELNKRKQTIVVDRSANKTQRLADTSTFFGKKSYELSTSHATFAERKATIGVKPGGFPNAYRVSLRPPKKTSGFTLEELHNPKPTR